MTSILVSWPGGSLESALKLGALILLSYALVLWLSAIVWVYRDVRNRTTDPTSQLIAVVLVAVFNVPGLIVYLVVRPQATMSDAYERSLGAEAILHELQLAATACQSCQRPIDDDFNICPSCRTILREPCRTCSRLIRTSWIACPYCAADRVPVRQPLASAPSRTTPLEPPRRTRMGTIDGELQPGPAPTRPPVPR